MHETIPGFERLAGEGPPPVRERRAADALQASARDGDPDVRLAALRGLPQHVRDAWPQTTVEQRLDDPDEAVRDGAAALLETFAE